MRRLPPTTLMSLGSRSRKKHHHDCSSIWAEGASTKAATAKGDLEDLLKSPAKKTTPPLLFPWRHGRELPARVTQRKESMKNEAISYEVSTAGITTMTAAFYFNNISFFQLFGNQWREDFAESCSWAFFQGLGSILSSTYQVPQESIAKYNNDGDISIDFNSNRTIEEKEELAVTEAASEKEDKDDNLIFEPKLYNLFHGAKKSGKDQLEVLLESTPTQATLHSLHALPTLSRSLAENHPQILQEIYEERASGTNNMGNNYTSRILTETGKVESTIFADVVVQCDERFWVKDLETGAIVQGNDDRKVCPVLHTLRLERVSTFVPEKGRTLGNWLVTDVDDLLDGNRWFTPPVRVWWQAD